MNGNYKTIAPITLLLTALLHLPASAADGAAYLAAGYKALFTCSATFLAQRTPAQIARDQLTGIYADFEAPLHALPEAGIDTAQAAVSVQYDSGLPPRIARFRKSMGCTLLPPGANADLRLPEIAAPMTPPAVDADWPDGDLIDNVPAHADDKGNALSRVIAHAFDSRSYGPGSRTSAVIVIRAGRILAEDYSSDSGIHVPQRTWSVAKTIMGALVGIASADGLLKPDEPAGLSEWSNPCDPRAGIRIADLMHMSSGLDTGPVGSRTDAVYFGGGRVRDHVPAHELAAVPGMRWFYANNDTLTLSLVLRQRMHDDQAYLSYPYRRLLHRIGMFHTTLEADWDGTYILSSQVWSTARDLSRLGLLLLNGGRWHDEQILPPGWTEFMARPAPAQPPASTLLSTPLPGYGAQVWLFGERQKLPDGSFAAMGNRGQYIMVIPSRDTVIVRRGFDPEGGRFAIDRFSFDVLKVLN
jgi:CubicO group peptidase (beta-lactamase class C family)